ncbi:amidohydrolase family protein [Roseibium sp. SCP14]|uniref:amidohydrolase family protein n=1 Tax=Roseibium sp. SCP14 TaxID=3141375 RepID=UPI003338C61E
MKLIIDNVRILASPTWAEPVKGRIVCENGRIAAIGPVAGDAEITADTNFLDGKGRLAMPGLINAHIHSSSAFMRGAVPGLPLEPYMLLEAPLDDFSHSPRLYYLRAMLTAIDMLRQGVVAVRDDVHFFGDPTPDNAGAIFEAYRTAGLRASVGFGIPNVLEFTKIPYLREHLTAEQRLEMERAKWPDQAEILSFYHAMFNEWHGSENDRLTVHTSCSTPHRVDPDTLCALSDLARRKNVSFDTHLLETKTQAVHSHHRDGKSLVRYLHDHGVLDERLVAIHSIWLNEEDLDLLADSGATVAHNPVSNLKLGSGVMPMANMLQRGIPIALGTDEVSVDDGNNLWTNAKIGMLLQSLADVDCSRWPRPEILLEAMTTAGARAMRRETAGRLAVGQDADIILLDTSGALYAPLNQLSRHLVGAETGASVRTTIVAGEIVMEDGRLKHIDENAILTEIHDLWDRYSTARDAANVAAQVLLPAYMQSANQALAQDLGFSRHLSGAIRTEKRGS